MSGEFAAKLTCRLGLGRTLVFTGAAVVVVLVAACGGGTRGTGIYGVDGMRPGTLFEDGKRVPQRVEPAIVATPTPTPAAK